MHPKSIFQGSSVKSSSISPNGLGGNAPFGASLSKYAGPHAHVGRGQVAAKADGRGVRGGLRCFRRTRQGDAGRSPPQDARPRDASAGLAEGKTLPCGSRPFLWFTSFVKKKKLTGVALSEEREKKVRTATELYSCATANARFEYSASFVRWVADFLLESTTVQGRVTNHRAHRIATNTNENLNQYLHRGKGTRCARGALAPPPRPS